MGRVTVFDEGRCFGVLAACCAIAIWGCSDGPAREESGPSRKSSALMLPPPGGSITISFDIDALGNPLPRGTVLGEQFAEWGVHFENAFAIGDRATDFPNYVLADTGNRLCTPEAGLMPPLPNTWEPGRCAGSPATGTPLIIDLDFPACAVSMIGSSMADHLDFALGRMSMIGLDADGAPIPGASSPTTEVFNTINCVGCPLIHENTAANGIPNFRILVDPRRLNVRKVIVSETNVGSLDTLTIVRCDTLFALCSSPSICTAPGQCSSGDAAVDVNGGSFAADGGPLTLSQTQTSTFPLGATPVTLTASEGAEMRTCQATVTVRDCEPPTPTCPPAASIECTGAPFGCTLYSPIPATIADNCGSAVLYPPGGCLPLGTSDVTQVGFDEAGNVGTCSSPVTVVDTQPPVVAPPVGPARELGPVDNQLHTVSLADCGVQITDACKGDIASAGTRITCVTSDEDRGPLPDIVLIDAEQQLVQLRVTRSRFGDGRVYTIHFVSTDAGGNSTPGSCQMTVPAPGGRRATADSGVHDRVCSSWCGPAGGLPCQYRAVDLASGGPGGVAYGINDRGQIVGVVPGSEPYDTRAVVWQNGRMIDLGTMGGGPVSPVAINNRGHVAGYGPTGDGRRAVFLWADGVFHELDGIPEGQAFALNDQDQVVGVMNLDGNSVGFLFDAGQVTAIGTPRGAVCQGINNKGQVVGIFDDGERGRAFLWEHGDLIALSDDSALSSMANAINDAGQIVGSYFDGVVDSAALWDHGHMIDLGLSALWGTPINSTATAINGRGEIVGSTNPPNGQPHAFHYIQGNLTNLNSTTIRSKLAINLAFGINGNGQIVGAGISDLEMGSHALLWLTR